MAPLVIAIMAQARVLIVEDDMLIALDVEHALREAGYDVCGVATSEAEALELAERLRPEMAVVDISLGPGDGRVVAKTLCRRLCNQGPVRHRPM